MSENDLSVMVRRAKDFIEDGDKVKLVVFFSGRQITHPEFGHKVLDRAISDLSGVSKVERERRLEGRKLIILVSPDKKGAVKKDTDGQNLNEEKKDKEISIKTV